MVIFEGTIYANKDVLWNGRIQGNTTGDLFPTIKIERAIAADISSVVKEGDSYNYHGFANFRKTNSGWNLEGFTFFD